MRIDNNYLTKSIMAGICISLGGFGFLSSSNVFFGAVIFAIGLICIVNLNYLLFTGKSGEINLTMMAYGIRALYLDDLKLLFKKILLGNIIGCILIGFLVLFGDFPDLSKKAFDLLTLKLNHGYLSDFLRAIGCGIIMDLIVHSFKTTKSIIPILFGVPAFIICGFLHSIAETFYIIAAIPYIRKEIILSLIIYFILIVLGNFIGCRIRKIFTFNFDINE